MAWVATEDFDGYTPGADLNTQNGGSGWSGAWSKISGTTGVTVETAPTGMSGQAARFRNPSDEVTYERSLTTAQSAGSVRVKLHITELHTGATDVGFFLADASNTLVFIRLHPSGVVDAFNNVTDVQIGTYSANTTITIDIEFDDGAQPDTFRARVDEGTWSSWLTVSGGSYTTITKVVIRDGWAAVLHDFFVDVIEPMPADGDPLGDPYLGMRSVIGAPMFGGVG